LVVAGSSCGVGVGGGEEVRVDVDEWCPRNSEQSD